MSKSTDSIYLKKHQYRDSSNLSVRANIHQDYSTNPKKWQHWIFEQIDLSADARALEIGCGPGYLWRENSQSVYISDHLILSDLSEGMLEEAREALSKFSSFSYTVIDAQDIPFPMSFFDVVIANHILFHVPDISKSLVEIKRVLKPGGCLYASTNGRVHLAEFHAWKTKYFQEEFSTDLENPADRFGLENGENQLRQYFSRIELVPYLDQLLIPDIDPIIRYLKSWFGSDLPPDKEDIFRSFLKKKLNKDGIIKITKDSGLFKCMV